MWNPSLRPPSAREPCLCCRYSWGMGSWMRELCCRDDRDTRGKLRGQAFSAKHARQSHRSAWKRWEPGCNKCLQGDWGLGPSDVNRNVSLSLWDMTFWNEFLGLSFVCISEWKWTEVNVSVQGMFCTTILVLEGHVWWAYTMLQESLASQSLFVLQSLCCLPLQHHLDVFNSLAVWVIECWSISLQHNNAPHKPVAKLGTEVNAFIQEVIVNQHASLRQPLKQCNNLIPHNKHQQGVYQDFRGLVTLNSTDAECVMLGRCEACWPMWMIPVEPTFALTANLGWRTHTSLVSHQFSPALYRYSSTECRQCSIWLSCHEIAHSFM